MFDATNQPRKKRSTGKGLTREQRTELLKNLKKLALGGDVHAAIAYGNFEVAKAITAQSSKQ